MCDDMVQVTLDMPIREWRELRREIRMKQEGITERDIAETKLDNPDA